VLPLLRSGEGGKLREVSSMRTTLVRAAALVALFALPGTAMAGNPAVVERVVVYATGTNVEEDFFCTGLSAIMTGSGTISYQVIATDNGFHVQGSERGQWTATIENGGYATGGSIDRFAFNAGPGDTVNKDTHVDWAAVYGPDGDLLFETTFRVVEKFTITADGDIRVDFARVVFNDAPC
jgi:hypothetical protein